MNIQWQNDIINGLIRENADATIADYKELVKELSEIEKHAFVESTINGNKNKIRPEANGVAGA